MQNIPKNAFSGKIDIPEETFALLLSTTENWHDFKSRGSNFRKIEQWFFFEQIIPEKYLFLTEIIFNMINTLNKIHQNKNIKLVTMLMCYYQDGNSSTGVHKHNCRSMTLSLGDKRKFKINNKLFDMKNGEYIILHKHSHGVPKQENVSNRISLNIFYCLEGESFQIKG